MRTRDWTTTEEIKNGLRILLATLHDFYISPYDLKSQVQRRNAILENYEKRDDKYTHYRHVLPGQVKQMNYLWDIMIHNRNL